MMKTPSTRNYFSYILSLQCYSRVIFKFTIEPASEKTWKEIQPVAKEILQAEVPYTRFNKTEGHIGVDKKDLKPEPKEKVSQGTH